MTQRRSPLVVLFVAWAASACGQSPVDEHSEVTSNKLSFGQIYRVMSVNSGLALDVIGISTTPGAGVQQWPYWNALNQRWQFQPNADGSYQLISVNSGLCLDVYDISTAPGAKVQQWNCWGGLNQAWDVVDVGDGASELVSVNSGLALDVYNISTTEGALLQQWPYWGGANQKWLIQPVDDNGNPTGGSGPAPSGSAPAPTPTPTPTPTPPPSPFGNVSLHPQKIGFYMVPDLESAYTTNGGAGGGCAWGTTQASLNKLHQLLPNTIVRWDNETGHYSDDPGSVSTFVSCANSAGVHMIVTASAIDGYNNWWANGGNTPNASLLDFARGPYLTFAHQLLQNYPVVQFVESANEPDGPWFNNDGDNVGDFDVYMNALVSAMGSDSGRILGPAAAINGSAIWNDFVARSNMSNFSYHTYGAAAGLTDVPGKNVYVTEYGGYNLDPGAILADLWNVEQQNKLSNTIQALFYVQLTDNGGNRGAFNATATEGNHFALRDWFRALTLYQAMANAGGTKGYVSTSNRDFFAADNGSGGFGALVFNNSGNTLSGSRTIPNTSTPAGAQLYVTHVVQGDAGVASCNGVSNQGTLTAQVNGSQVAIQITNLEPHAAALISTQPCDNLAN